MLIDHENSVHCNAPQDRSCDCLAGRNNAQRQQTSFNILCSLLLYNIHCSWFFSTSSDIFQPQDIAVQCLSQIVALLQPMQEFFVGDLSIATWPKDAVGDRTPRRDVATVASVQVFA
jgi:hypothetical protein